jgi:negative regulator of replication initiation
MHSIEIDDAVFVELSRRATGFHVSPNDVLRRILNLAPVAVAASTSPTFPSNAKNGASPLHAFIQSEHFQRYQQAVDRYLSLLAWLHFTHAKKFVDVVLGFRRGNRLYFGTSQQEVERSGAGIAAKQIPKSPLWALTTLDNRTKRLIIEDLLQTLNYPGADIKFASAQLPDSDIRRRHGVDFYK